MKNNEQIRITNSHDSVVIDIEGTIGVPENWQFEDPQQRIATYEKFRETVKHIEDIAVSRVIVNIRSTGGDVNDALLIYEALTSLDAVITTRCWGYVASAATVIAQAASDGQREISPNSLYLIHNSTCAADGNAAELEQRAELLKKSDERLGELYARRSGRDAESFWLLMAEQGGDGRWLNAKEAIEAGLADCEIDTNTIPDAALEGLDDTEEQKETVAEKVANALSSVRAVIEKVGKKLRGGDEDEELENALDKDDEDVESDKAEEDDLVDEFSSEDITEEILEDDTEDDTEDDAEEEEETVAEDDVETETETEDDSEEEEKIGLSKKQALPKVKNAALTKVQKSLIAFEEGQKEMKQSETNFIDDPSLVDVLRSDNQNAYERDARRMRGSL